jgi:hypothetical protein
MVSILYEQLDQIKMITYAIRKKYNPAKDIQQNSICAIYNTKKSK